MSAIRAAKNVWPFDIGVVGLGIVGTHQITRETEQVIRRSNHTFVIESGFGITDYLKTLCPDVTNLGSFYERGKSRLPTYRKMAATVVAAALSKPPVCLAAYGHPWVYCYPTTLIKRSAALLNLHVEVFPGISAFDNLLVDLGIDLAFDGVQMYEATDLLLRRRPIQNDVTCVIWQSTIVGDPTYPDKPFPIQQFQPLQDYLVQFFPANHEVALVVSKTFPLLRSIVRKFPLERLAEEVRTAPPLGTLFIPPAFSRPIQDEALLKRMLATERQIAK
jgi:precorrin-3B methylase